MSKIKKRVLLVCIIILLTILMVIIKNSHSTRIDGTPIELTAVQKIPIPVVDNHKEGFTCTGIYYDNTSSLYYVGNAGKLKPTEESFKATIEILNSDFKHIKTLKLYQQFPNMRDIQGVTKNDDSIWFCSYGENLVRHIDLDGKEIGKFYVQNPSGIAFNAVDNSLWVLTDNALVNFSMDGKKKKSFHFKVPGQDQLYLDEADHIIYITAGLDYQGDSYVYSFDTKNETFCIEYVLPDSNAIEGITIVDDRLYILNDGYYHDAKDSKNQINVYHLKNR